MAGTLSPAIFLGCTNVANGTTGIVPAPVAGMTNAFLRGDGLWASPALNGFVAGPNASTDGTIAVFAGVAGNVIRDTGVSIDGGNNLSGVALLTTTTLSVGALTGMLYGNAGAVGARTLTGTAGTITVTNGTGVAGNPTITIDATYIGQASITTLGTITTGVWNGTAVDIAHGGTGQVTKTAAFDALSPLTTKGDLVVFDGTHNIRVGVGSDGQVLQANSGAASGVSWTTNPAGAYDTIDNAGVALTQRNILNFSGSGITAVDNAGATRTDVALAGTLVDIAGLTPTNATVVYGNGTHFTNASTFTTNTYYVSKNGNDATGDGSKNFPFLTVSAACTAIGNAASSVQFNDTTLRYYTIYIDAGIYVENVTVPSRPDVIFDMHGSVIQGNVAQDLDRTLLTGALNTAKVSIIGYDMRGAHSGLSLPKIGVDGNVTMGSSVGANNFTSLYLINTGVTGNVLYSGVNPGYQGFLFTQNTNISGSINTSGTGVNINCYLNQAATSGTAGIGGCNGFVNLSAINNINFNGPVITNSNAAGRLWNTVFKSGQAHNFTGSTAALGMDANTYDSYFNNVPTKGGETITLIDTARGVNAAYVPSNYTAATVDVRANLVGIDTAIGTKQPLNASLTALAALASTGLIAQTGANTFSDRTITGTAGTITVTNGTGVAGNPTITIDATYVGQASITTLGTITSGTWNGSVVGAQYGGTGVASPTAHGIMVAEGAGAMVSKVLTDGQLLIGSTGADPVAASLTAGANITITPGAGTITIAASAGAGGYATVENNGTPLTARTTLNFAGTGLVAADNGGTSATDVTLASGISGWNGFNTNGILTQTANNTYTGRTITGTAGTITVTNGDGVAGNPTLTIDATYVGQASITTLGTIGTGVWNGSVISGTYGGTGVNNGASTITIGGNVTFSGAFATTLTVTAGTSVTLPTSGTLVNTGVTTLSSLASVGTVTTGTWSAGLKDYTETVTSASTGAAYTVNMANGNWFKLTLTANCTLSLSNVPATGGQGCSLTLALIQDATGSRTVTWPASFDWGTAGAPTLTTTANKVDLVTAISDDNGTTFRALLAGKGFGA